MKEVKTNSSDLMEEIRYLTHKLYSSVDKLEELIVLSDKGWNGKRGIWSIPQGNDRRSGNGAWKIQGSNADEGWLYFPYPEKHR